MNLSLVICGCNHLNIRTCFFYFINEDVVSLSENRTKKFVNIIVSKLYIASIFAIFKILIDDY